MILKQVSFTFTSDSLIKSWKKRLLTVVIDTDTEHQIYYLINGLRLHDGDREIILRTEITDITTEVFRSDENPKRRHCLDWYTVSKLSIKDHWWWKWGRPHVNNEEGTENAEEVNIIHYEEIW